MMRRRATHGMMGAAVAYKLYLPYRPRAFGRAVSLWVNLIQSMFSSC